MMRDVFKILLIVHKDRCVTVDHVSIRHTMSIQYQHIRTVPPCDFIGYHIQPNVRIIQQMNMALAIIFIMVGFINGVLGMITFKKKSIREVRYSWYLLGSSITTLY